MSSGLKPNKAALRPWKVPSTWSPWNQFELMESNGKTQGSIIGEKRCTKGLWGLRCWRTHSSYIITSKICQDNSSVNIQDMLVCFFRGPTAQQTLYKHVLAASPCLCSSLNPTGWNTFTSLRMQGSTMLPVFRPTCWWGIPRPNPD